MMQGTQGRSGRQSLSGVIVEVDVVAGLQALSKNKLLTAITNQLTPFLLQILANIVMPPFYLRFLAKQSEFCYRI